VLVCRRDGLPVFRGDGRGDSLWTTPNSDQRSICADRKASRVGDIITIVVSETAAQVSSQSKTTNSTSAVDASVSQFLFRRP